MPATASSGSLILARGLQVHVPLRQGVLRRPAGTARIVDDVDLDIAPAEVMVILGERGAGKSTLARALLYLIRPSGGRVQFAGQTLGELGRAALRDLRRDMQLVFEDPYAALNPGLTVAQQLTEPLAVHGLGDRREREERVEALLGQVGANPFLAGRRPYELSGGLRQRVAIARALATGPRLLVLDEPTATLDPVGASAIQALLRRLQRELGLTILYLTSEPGEARDVGERVGVMYAGRLVEVTARATLFAAPLHPYTQALLSRLPLADWEQEAGRDRLALEGRMPDPARRPAGCAFHPRCRHATERCRQEDPALRELGEGPASHRVACHHAEHFR